MGRMPPALARYWAKHGRGKAKKKASKPKKQKSRGGGHTAKGKGKGKHKNGKKGIFMGMGLFDFAQIADNASLVGVGAAANQALTGDFEAAGNTLASNAMSNFPNLIIHNIMWMLVRKVGKKYMGKMGRYF